MLRPDWHDAALPRAQSDLVVAELDHEIAAPDHDDLGAARVTVLTPLAAAGNPDHADADAAELDGLFPPLRAGKLREHFTEVRWPVHEGLSS